MLKEDILTENEMTSSSSDNNTMNSVVSSKLESLFGTSNLKDGHTNFTTGGQTLDISKELYAKSKDPEWKLANKEKYEYHFNQPTSKLQQMMQKNNIDLKSKTTLFNIPDQVSSILSTDENEYSNLSDLERGRIRDAKKRGLKITGRMMSSLKNNLDVAIEEGYGIKSKQFLLYLNEKKIDFNMLDEKIIREYGEAYKRDRRPPIHILIKYTLSKLTDVLIEILSKVENASDNEKLIFIESQEARDAFISSVTAAGQQVFNYDDFGVVEYYFNEYGLHQDDVDRLNPDNIVKEGVTLQDYYDIFKTRSGYDFIDVYTHFADKFKTNGNTSELKHFSQEDIDNVTLQPISSNKKIESTVDLSLSEVEVTEILEF